MIVPLADIAANPYASPQLAPATQPAEQSPAPTGSLAIIVGGFVLLLVGYLTSNLFAVSDLYGIGMGPDGKVIPSPLAAVFTTPAQKWLFYIVSGAAFVGGAVMLGSQRFNPIAVVCYVMCPLAGAVFFVASPLRVVQKYAEPLAALYLLVGSALTFAGATRLFQLYGNNSNGSFAPVAASMMTQVGLALALGAMIKFGKAGDKAVISAEAALPAPTGSAASVS